MQCFEMDELIHRIVSDLLFLLELLNSWSICGQYVAFDFHIKAAPMFSFKFFLKFNYWYLLGLDDWQCYFFRLGFMFEGFF